MKFTINGVLSLDGVYDLDFNASPFTNRELHWIKQIAGVRLNELYDAYDAGDTDVVVALTIIALVRNGALPRENVKQATELLLDAEAGKISISDDDEAEEKTEDDAIPPVEAPPSVSGNENGTTKSTPTSSEASNGTGDAQSVTVPASTGQPG